LGYRVLSASDGPSALDIIEQNPRIDLLFSDIVMPGGMNGFDLISKARDIRSELKALVARAMRTFIGPALIGRTCRCC
jgi:CheY-like chemotaxis protein